VGVCKGRYVFTPGTVETANAALEERCPAEVAGTP
jgi:hypothetical protein